jgi:hypothetical protein
MGSTYKFISIRGVGYMNKYEEVLRELLTYDIADQYKEIIRETLEEDDKMNNWDVRKEVFVYMDGDTDTNMTSSELEQVANRYGSSQARSIMPAGYTSPIFFHAPSDVEDTQLIEAFAGLQDHMENTHIGEWTQEQGDYECDNGMYVTEYYGTYYGQGLQMEVHIFQL